MAINVDALKTQLADQLLISQPSLLGVTPLASTSIYTNPLAPGQTIGVPVASSQDAEVNPTDFIAGGAGVSNLDVTMQHVQAKRYLTFAQIQAGIDPALLAQALISDIIRAIGKATKGAALGSTTANVVAKDLTTLWGKVQGRNKVCVFDGSYLGVINGDKQQFRMDSNNVLEPGAYGFRHAQYEDAIGFVPGSGAIAWSADDVALALAPMIPIGDANESVIAAGAGLPGIYSRITVAEATRKVTVTAELMVGAKAIRDGISAKIA